MEQEYLLLLNTRSKLRKENPFHRSWPMGTIVEVFLGTDGLVRAVAIRMQGELFRRPIHKLIKLLGEEDQELILRGGGCSGP